MDAVTQDLNRHLDIIDAEDRHERHILHIIESEYLAEDVEMIKDGLCDNEVFDKLILSVNSGQPDFTKMGIYFADMIQAIIYKRAEQIIEESKRYF